MAVNAFVSFFDKADGESIQKGKEKWIEIQGWRCSTASLIVRPSVTARASSGSTTVTLPPAMADT